MEWEPVIGLEIHAELRTKTKMFCSCLNDPEEKIPNKNICPVCLAHPGTLPTINKKAVEEVIKVGLALGSKIPEYSKFDRKNYFYPDLPKGYQISQYDEPLCKGGALPLYLSNDPEERKKRIQITRVHLEEDVGKIIHLTSQGKPTATLIDYNRAGIPLMELVTEPVMHSGREARLFAQGLQLLLRTLEVSKANMEEGEMRCEVNISLHQKGQEKLGTKVEIKNLNSFRAVEQATDFEIERQREILEKGENVVQETRGWDAKKGITYHQRLKEGAQDYRYLPEPDLPPLHLYSREKEGGLFLLEELRKALPELPWEKKDRLMREYNLTSLQANLLITEEKLLDFFQEVVKELGAKKSSQFISLAYNYLATDLKGIMEAERMSWEELKISPSDFSQLVILLEEGKISSRAGKNVLLEMAKTGKPAGVIVKEQGLEKITALEDLNPLVEKIISQNEKAVADYRKGKENALKFLVGQAMAQTRGAADPKVLEKLFRDMLR